MAKLEKYHVFFQEMQELVSKLISTIGNDYKAREAGLDNISLSPDLSNCKTNEKGDGYANAVSGKVEPFATTTAASAVGLQQFYESAHQYGGEPAEKHSSCLKELVSQS